jgi:hypothetical protein
MLKNLSRFLILGCLLAATAACQAAPQDTTPPAAAPTSPAPVETLQLLVTQAPRTPGPAAQTPGAGLTPTAEKTALPQASGTARPALPALLLHSEPVQAASADLAARLGASVADVQVVSAETEELPLQDLGCPSGTSLPPKGGAVQPGSPEPAIPGMVIGQVIRLSAAGQTYEYHIYAKRVIFCGLSGR